jgi:hypothetical protein
MSKQTPKKFIEVAVLSPRRIDFNLWVGVHKKEGERYHFIDEPIRATGLIFHRVEKGYKFYEIPNWSKLYELCCLRLRDLPIKKRHK